MAFNLFVKLDAAYPVAYPEVSTLKASAKEMFSLDKSDFLSKSVLILFKKLPKPYRVLTLPPLSVKTI